MPVVTEKPFVTTSAEADRLIALAAEKGKILTVFHSQSVLAPDLFLAPLLCSLSLLHLDRRFDSDFRTLNHLVSQGALGDVLEADIHFDYPDPGWISDWTQKEYIVGEGMTFGLGKSLNPRDV
jgi:predicted dehydrogenase